MRILMESSRVTRWLAVLVLGLLSRAELRADVMITEFMASNQSGFQDEDSEYVDWLELYNSGPLEVNLAGWSLSDEPENDRKWVFPEVVMAPGSFLVVYASGKNRALADAPLHTNFRLEEEGEFVGLFDTAGRDVSVFFPQFPTQESDASYGLDMTVDVRTLADGATTVKYLVPENADLDEVWMTPEFDDAAWASGAAAIGYDNDEELNFKEHIATDLGALMEDINSTVYVRLSFELTPDDMARLLQLRIQVDSAYVAYLNGVEVARYNAPSSPRYNSRGLLRRTDAEVLEFLDVSLETARDSLQVGTNLLAIHAMNNSRTSTDFLLVPRIEAMSVTSVSAESPKYFAAPTPGFPNRNGVDGVATVPVASRPSGAYEPFSDLTLTVDDPQGVIRYTLNGADPSPQSDIYTGPLAISGVTKLRARTFRDGLLPSRTVTYQYVMLDATAASFSSNLPVVVINTFGTPVNQGGCDRWTDGNLLIVEPGADGRSRLIGGKVDFMGRAGFKKRGSSTIGREKFSMTVELQDDSAVAANGILTTGVDRSAPLLGMPAESDWILYGPENFDRALMRNPLIYELSNQVGQYAMRTRFVEVFLNQSAGPVRFNTRGGSTQHYWGVYVLMEKIKRDANRVPVERLEAHHDSMPEISGGYMYKVDRAGCDIAFTARGTTFRLFTPNEPTGPQRNWITQWMTEFLNVLNAPVFSDPVNGYAKYIDVQSWIDHHMLNMYPMNVDAFRLSGYMYKFRNGPLHMGPIWDFDRSMESTDGRDDNPRSWEGTGDSSLYFRLDSRTPWWFRIFQDPNFDFAYKQRWLELRDGPLSTQNINSVIDDYVSQLSEAQVRNFQRWSNVAPRFGSWMGEVNNLKNWLATRAAWIDDQFILPPRLSHEGGFFTDPFELTLEVFNGEAWYTLNGEDPRGDNSAPHPEAIRWDGTPILISENTQVIARTRVGSRVWSATPASATYYNKVEPLVVTEINYSPLPDPEGNYSTSDYEFIELFNAGREPISLVGVRIGDRMRFDFNDGDVTELAPGAYIVVARNREAFASRYGTDGITVVGDFGGLLSNSSQEIRVLGPLDVPYAQFTYDDGWDPSTDGDGYTLVAIDPHAPPEMWDSPVNWKASEEILGSPGRRDGPPAQGLQRPGDVNQDARLNTTDVVLMLRHLFGGGIVLPCETESGNTTLLDVNGDSEFNLSDPVHVLRYLFRRQAPPSLGVDCTPIEGCPFACRD